MSQWSSVFETIMEQMETESLERGVEFSLLHAFVKSWEFEQDCLVWLTVVPGNNLFGSTVVFVNDKVLNNLQWTFEEWENGTAPAAVFREGEAKNINLHLLKKSQIPILAHVRKKTTPPNQEGDDYYLLIHFDMPYNLRLTVGVPYEE